MIDNRAIWIWTLFQVNNLVHILLHYKQIKYSLQYKKPGYHGGCLRLDKTDGEAGELLVAVVIVAAVCALSQQFGKWYDNAVNSSIMFGHNRVDLLIHAKVEE